MKFFQTLDQTFAQNASMISEHIRVNESTWSYLEKDEFRYTYVFSIALRDKITLSDK